MEYTMRNSIAIEFRKEWLTRFADAFAHGLEGGHGRINVATA